MRNRTRSKRAAPYEPTSALLDDPHREVLDSDMRRRLSESITQDGASGCWVWRNRPDRYGQITVAKQVRPAHRFVMEIYTGRTIPQTHHIHHRFETKGCVNPAHLMVLTPEQHRAMHARRVGGKS